MPGSDLSYLVLRFFGHLTNGHPERNVFPFSQDFHLYLSIDLRTRNNQGKIVGLFDLLSIVFCDDIADLYPAKVGRSACKHFSHKRSVGLLKTESIGKVRSHFLNSDPHPPPRHLTFGLELRQQLLYLIYRSRKSDSDVASRLADNRHIDTHHLATQVD